jgi:hypothetical protein
VSGATWAAAGAAAINANVAKLRPIRNDKRVARIKTSRWAGRPFESLPGIIFL